MVGKGDGVFHEPEPALVVPVIEVLGGDVLDGLLPEEEEDIVAFGHGSNEVGGWLKILKDELSSSYQLSHPGFMHKQNDLYGPQIQIQKDLGPHVLLEPWSLTMKGRFIKSKLYVMSLIAI